MIHITLLNVDVYIQNYVQFVNIKMKTFVIPQNMPQ